MPFKELKKIYIFFYLLGRTSLFPFRVKIRIPLRFLNVLKCQPILVNKICLYMFVIVIKILINYQINDSFKIFLYFIFVCLLLF